MTEKRFRLKCHFYDFFNISLNKQFNVFLHHIYTFPNNKKK